MPVLSRRGFLRNGSFTVIAAGAAVAVPGFSSLLTASAADAPALDGTVARALENPSPYSELVAHVRDLGTGEIAVYHGTEEVTFHDPDMAARLFRASGRNASVSR